MSRSFSVSLIVVSLLVWFVIGFQVLAAESGGAQATSTPETATSTPDVFEEEDSNATTTPETAEEEHSEDTATSTPSAASTTPETTAPTLDLEADITLPNTCEVEDKNGVLYTFPTTSSPSEYLTICALAAAQSEGDIESYQLGSFPGFGLFVEGVNGIIAAADEFWSLFLNGEFAECGIECLPLNGGDIISFVLTSFEGEERGAEVALHVTALIEVSQEEEEEAGEEEGDDSDPNPGGGSSQSNSFDVPAAIAFLTDHQDLNGSFGDDVFTDWVAVAFGAVNGGDAESELKDYLRAANPSLSSLTDYERHALGLMALGINPYTGTEVDYITPIVEAFDGSQIGESSLVNDDVFAIFPLLKAGYDTEDEIIQKTVAFIVSKQGANGSWEESIDFTAATVQALASADNLTGVSEALNRAKTYLHTQQDGDGSFDGNVFSTSWAMQAIEAFGESDSEWSPDGDSPENFLAGVQSGDGGVLEESESIETRVWATAYAIPAVREATWLSLLSSFSKPSSSTNSGGSGGSSSSSNDSEETATSTSSGEATSTATTTPLGLVLGESTTAATETTPPAFSLPTLSTAPVPSETEDEATTSLATTSNQHVAAAVESIEGWSDLWTWSLGLLFIFFSLLYAYFFRNSF